MKILSYYLIFINTLAIVTVYRDKKKSISHKWRIPESRFFLISILFGSAGTLLGMYIFRHKTKHKKFTIFIPIILVIEIFLLAKFVLNLF